jgi:group II intron reverse transcriptase/maturase
MAGPPKPTTISTKLQRIATLAKDAPEMAFTTLAHHVDVEWLKEAFRRTRKNAAAGVDGQTAAEYAANLDANLRSLLDRAKAGTYRAPPVRRVYIPKGEGNEKRPIGIPTLEDRVLQRAIAMLLEPIYEHDFLPSSYGFRPRRSAHQLLNDLQFDLWRRRGGWVIELDIRKFYDTLDHDHLRAFISRRVRDGVVTRLIGKWLRAGVLEEGQRHESPDGTPQGGVISPLLANIFLHEVLDKWFELEVKPRLSGLAELFRYADDAVLVFSNENDARRVLAVLAKRFAKYGLALHPEKTRLLEFLRPDTRPKTAGRVATFDLLGFTHYWGRSRNLKWIVKRRTAQKRFRRSARVVATWCRENRHRAVRDQHLELRKKLTGHYNYYGITGNYALLYRFMFEVKHVWRKWLNRRSDRAKMTCPRMSLLLERYPLPMPKIAVHYDQTQQNRFPKSRMQQSCTSGSVGGAGA